MACTACQGETTQRYLLRSALRLSSTAIVTLLTHSPPLPHRWTFWSQYCGAVYVTQCVIFQPPSLRLTLIFISDDQISGRYVMIFVGENIEGLWSLTSPLFIDIPGGTAVPHWTYLNVTTSDMWDAAAARAVVGQSSVYFS